MVVQEEGRHALATKGGPLGNFIVPENNEESLLWQLGEQVILQCIRSQNKVKGKNMWALFSGLPESSALDPRQDT